MRDAHALVTHLLSQHARAQDTGAPVVNGAISTLIATLFLSASGSYVFISFFYALLIIVLAGAFQGLIVLPVLMSIFKPSAHVAVGKAAEAAAAEPAPPPSGELAATYRAQVAGPTV